MYILKRGRVQRICPYLFGLIGPSLELDSSPGGVSPFRLNSCMHLSLLTMIQKNVTHSPIIGCFQYTEAIKVHLIF